MRDIRESILCHERHMLEKHLPEELLKRQEALSARHASAEERAKVPAVKAVALSEHSRAGTAPFGPCHDAGYSHSTPQVSGFLFKSKCQTLVSQNLWFCPAKYDRTTWGGRHRYLTATGWRVSISRNELCRLEAHLREIRAKAARRCHATPHASSDATSHACPFHGGLWVCSEMRDIFFLEFE